MSEGNSDKVGYGKIHAGIRVSAEISSYQKGQRKAHSDNGKDDEKNTTFVFL